MATSPTAQSLGGAPLRPGDTAFFAASGDVALTLGSPLAAAGLSFERDARLLFRRGVLRVADPGVSARKGAAQPCPPRQYFRWDSSGRFAGCSNPTAFDLDRYVSDGDAGAG